MLEVCETDNRKNVGKTRCGAKPFAPAWMLVTPTNFYITEANLATVALLKAALQTALKATKLNRVYKFPTFTRIEDKSLAALYVENAHGSNVVHNGRERFTAFLSESLCTHKAMYSHSWQNDGRVILGDLRGQIRLIKGSDGNYRGERINLLNVENLKVSKGEDATETPIYLSLLDPTELNESGYLFDAGQVYNELEPLTDVTLTVSVVDTDNLRVYVRNACDGSYISGLVQADFVVTTTAGASQVLSAFATANDADGNPYYTLTKASDFADGYVNLVAASALTLDAYESTGKVAFDIP